MWSTAPPHSASARRITCGRLARFTCVSPRRSSDRADRGTDPAGRRVGLDRRAPRGRNRQGRARAAAAGRSPLARASRLVRGTRNRTCRRAGRASRRRADLRTSARGALSLELPAGRNARARSPLVLPSAHASGLPTQTGRASRLDRGRPLVPRLSRLDPDPRRSTRRTRRLLRVRRQRPRARFARLAHPPRPQEGIRALRSLRRARVGGRRWRVRVGHRDDLLCPDAPSRGVPSPPGPSPRSRTSRLPRGPIACRRGRRTQLSRRGGVVRVGPLTRRGDQRRWPPVAQVQSRSSAESLGRGRARRSWCAGARRPPLVRRDVASLTSRSTK
jgi:hypothetical protein